MSVRPTSAGADQAPATISYEYGVLEPNGEVRVMPEAAARDRVRIAHPSWGMKVVRRVVITGEWVEDGPTTAVSAGIPYLVDRLRERALLAESANVRLREELAELERQRAAVLELHKPVPGVRRDAPAVCPECEDPYDPNAAEWPCPTVRALGITGEEVTR